MNTNQTTPSTELTNENRVQKNRRSYNIRVSINKLFPDMHHTMLPVFKTKRVFTRYPQVPTSKNISNPQADYRRHILPKDLLMS